MMINAKPFVLGLLLFIGSSEIFASANNAVVLMYHRFGENKYPATNIRQEQFIEQLDFLQKNHYQVWPLPKIIAHLQNRQSLPEKVVALTVDDAYLSVFNVAFPILKRRGLPFTLFVSTDPVDMQYSDYMSWQQINEMVASGVTLGNHSRSHNHLVDKLLDESEDAWLARVMDEVTFADRRIKQMSGVDTKLFAYPYGEFNLLLSETFKKNSYIAFGQHSGSFDANSDPGFLPRFPVSEEYADIHELSLKLSSLPMPIKQVLPLDVISKTVIPSMLVQLSIVPTNKNELQCYATGQISPVIIWHSDFEFSVTAAEAFKKRRGRFNCTLKDVKSGRYFWYSHLWIRPELKEE